MFIEQLGAGPVYLVGHSRGGRVAFDAARIRPELIRKLVLMEATLYSLLPVPSGTTTADSSTAARRRPVLLRFEQGDIEGGLEFYYDDANSPGTWKRRTEAQRQVSRDNAWTLVADDAAWSVTCAEGRQPADACLVGRRGEKLAAARQCRGRDTEVLAVRETGDNPQRCASDEPPESGGF
jgi:pimeloyl-ACP methyl ester carboxylesterase